MKNNRILKSKEVFIYGILGIPIAFLGFPLYIYLPAFYVEDIGLSLGIVGVVLFTSRIIDMLIDPFIGKISDKCCKRKTLILFASFFLLLGIYFLVNPIYKSVIWLFCFSTLTYISYSFVLIPYLALNSQLQTNEKENTKLSFSREIFIIIGVLLALLIPYLFEVSNSSRLTLDLLVKFLFIITPIILILFFIFIKEDFVKKQHKDFLKSIKIFFKNNSNNNNIFLAFLFNNLANALSATLFLFYVKYILNLENKAGEFLLVYFLSSIIIFYFWIKLSNKIGLESTWMISITISLISFSFVPFISEFDYLYFLLVCIFTGMCLGADMAIPTAIQSKIANENKQTGNNVTGVLFGFWAMITKFSLSLAVLIAFLLLDYNFQTINMDEVSKDKLIFLYSILPIILKIFSILFIYRYKLTNKAY